LQQLITLVINFPANRIKEAIRKALLGILQGEARLLKDGLVSMVSVTMFQTLAPSEESADVFGRINVSATLRSMENVLTMVAVPIWGLSLSMLALAIVLRNATASGYDLGDIAYEFIRWALICFCSGNGMGIANMIHIGFNLMAEVILNKGGVNANNFIEALLPAAAIQLQTFPIVILMVMMIVSAVIVVVMALSYIARAVLVLAFVGLAPLAFATEAIPYTRFVFREWLGTFLRIEMLQIINAFAYLVWAKVLASMAAGAGDYQQLLEMERMNVSYLGPILLSSLAALGFASVVIAINWSVFKFVFGVAVEVVNGLQRAAGAVFGFMTTALNGAAPSPALAMGANATGNPMLQGMTMGQRLGQQQHQLATHQTPDEQRQRDRADAASHRQAMASRADAAATARKASDEKRDAGYQTRARQQQARALARDAGARSEAEVDSVAAAHSQLAERYGEAAASRGMKTAAAFTNDRARQLGRGGSGLSKAAHQHGANSAGAFVGGAAEDVIRSEKGRDETPDAERVFPSLVNAASQMPGQRGTPANRQQDKPKSTTPPATAKPQQAQSNQQSSARVTSGNERETLKSMARSTGARAPAEIDSVAAAYQTLVGGYGEEAATQGVETVAAEMRSSARQQGKGNSRGLSQAARSRGFVDAGHMVGRAAEDSILQAQGRSGLSDEERIFAAPQSASSGIASSSPAPQGTYSSKNNADLQRGEAISQNSGQVLHNQHSPTSDLAQRPSPRIDQRLPANGEQRSTGQASRSTADQNTSETVPSGTLQNRDGSAASTSSVATQAQSLPRSENAIDRLMAQQPSMARGDWRQTSWFDHLAANQALQSIHGDPASAPQFAEMMRDVRQLPASMTSGVDRNDAGLFRRILTGAEQIGQRSSNPQTAYSQFREFVEDELNRSGEAAQVRLPWRQETDRVQPPRANTPEPPQQRPYKPPTPHPQSRQPGTRRRNAPR
jgi:hypothetical protein